jgi:hypothetical protein
MKDDVLKEQKNTPAIPNGKFVYLVFLIACLRG